MVETKGTLTSAFECLPG